MPPFLRQIRLSRQELALVAVTMLWGATFLIIHVAMRHCGPLFFVGLRFVTAGLVAALVFRRALNGLTRRELMAGSLIGISILLGYALQTWGLQSINSSESAFITAMYVPLVPLLQWLVLRRPPRLMHWVGITLAFIGLLLLAGPQGDGLELSAGHWVTVISTFAIAAEILLIGYFAGSADAAGEQGVDVRRVTVVQLLVAGTLSFLLMPVADEALPDFSWVWLVSAMGLGLASALIQWTMNWAQRTVPPTRATLIYAGEPVWGGVVGRLAGERLPGLALLGGVCIVLSVIVSELKLALPTYKSSRKASTPRRPGTGVTKPVKASERS